MSAEEGPAQPPKAAATFSSFINKNTTGKKFAPKAARRRLPATTTAPPVALAAPEPQSALPEPATSHIEPSSTSQLPTPAATQDLTSTPVETLGEPHVPQEPHYVATVTPTGEAEDGMHPSRASRRTEFPTPEPSTVPEVAATRADEYPRQEESEDQGTVVPRVPTTATASSEDQAIEASAALPGPATTAATAPSRQTRPPWVAVNHPQDDQEGAASVPSKTARQLTRTRRGRKATTDAIAENVEQEAGEDDDSDLTRQRPRAKARGKRNAAMSEEERGAQQSVKRTRKPRKAKGNNATGNAETTEGEGGQETDLAAEVTARRKPRQPRTRKKASTEGADDAVQGASQSKRKGRPPREATPSDAEDHVLDPEATYMDTLASRNIRVGKLSRREMDMRAIDWDEVRQRRREEDSRPIQSKEAQEAADKALNKAGADLAANNTELGPRFRVVGDKIEMIPESGTINREADAEREIGDYQIVEDRGITSRITSRSFLKNNKRFPNEFILPGQGKRWNTYSTDLFYQGLKSFGTDFQMISHMFPGSTRRSIKTKFTREERDDPERVKEALHGQSEMASHWDVFLEASQMNEESFADTDEIKRQLAEDEARMRELITAAEEETRLRNVQKEAAGVLDNEHYEANAGDKENGKGGKTKRKGKDKQVTFEDDPGVEILGTMSDNDTWGRE